MSELTVMVQTSLKRCGYPGDRWYKRRPIPSQPDCTTEAGRSPQSTQTSQADA